MKQQVSSIALLICGGTLDKDYNPQKGELGFSQTHLPELLAQAQQYLPLNLKTVMLKDSLEMDQTDREQLYQACIDCAEPAIVITHGTDTMTDSADYLLSQIQTLANKTIVLTGAMRPFRLGESDASFNLGAALMAAQTTRPGVYICMSGQLFNAGQVKKNHSLGRFEQL